MLATSSMARFSYRCSGQQPQLVDGFIFSVWIFEKRIFGSFIGVRVRDDRNVQLLGGNRNRRRRVRVVVLDRVVLDPAVPPNAVAPRILIEGRTVVRVQRVARSTFGGARRMQRWPIAPAEKQRPGIGCRRHLRVVVRCCVPAHSRPAR